MQTETFEAKRTAEGTIDIQHYARAAAAERRAAKSKAVRQIGRRTKQTAVAIMALFAFWNIPPMGGAGSKEMPYR